MQHLEAAYARDIEIRVEDEKLAREHVAIAVKEFTEDGIVYQAGHLRVIAFTVDHGDAIKPAYGYRIEYQGRVARLRVLSSCGRARRSGKRRSRRPS